MQTLSTGSKGIIALSVPSQIIFPNVINAGPACSIDGITYTCSLTEVFGEQILTISNAPVGVKSDGS